MNDPSCRYCDQKFNNKDELMRHRKYKHEKNVAICRENIDGQCKFNDHCWYKHNIPNNSKSSQNPDEIGKNGNLEKESIIMEISQ